LISNSASPGQNDQTRKAHLTSHGNSAELKQQPTTNNQQTTTNNQQPTTNKKKKECLGSKQQEVTVAMSRRFRNFFSNSNKVTLSAVAAFI